MENNKRSFPAENLEENILEDLKIPREQKQQLKSRTKQKLEQQVKKLNNDTQEENSPEPEDGIMFPDLWTSSNLLKITFNL